MSSLTLFLPATDLPMVPLLHDGVGLGDGTIPEPAPEDIPFVGTSCEQTVLCDLNVCGCVDVTAPVMGRRSPDTALVRRRSGGASELSRRGKSG